MTTTPRIILNHLSFQFEHTPIRFHKVNLTFETLKYGVVGQNGVGKSTFLKLLSGKLTPDSGSIQRSGSIIDVPQSHAAICESKTISDVLGTTNIIHALHHINAGSIDENDFEIVGDNWDIEKRIAASLSTFNLWPIDLDKPFQQLSGGQKTKVLLARTLVFPADFLLFDEPTNNLDTSSRAILYQYIEKSKQGLIIISHDRILLNKLDKIIEINTKSIDVYGGDYDFYKKQKDIKLQAIQQEIQARTENLTKSKQTIQTRMERHQQNESRGRKGTAAQIKAKGRYDKIEIKSKKGKSENTNRRIRLQASRKLETVNTALDEARSKFEVQEDLNVGLSATSVPNNKVIIKIKDLCFSYHEADDLIDYFDLQIIGPDRIAITGPNGCGKSTLIKLISGELIPQAGNITIGVNHIAYLDQTVSILDKDLTLVDNFLKLNPKSTPFEAYSALAAFKFRNIDAEKLVGTLSGGERMRAGLAISLLSKHPPQLIILDEPTNHLDLSAIEAIENMLKLYQGAILAVSHDKQFLANIGIIRTIELRQHNSD